MQHSMLISKKCVISQHIRLFVFLLTNLFVSVEQQRPVGPVQEILAWRSVTQLLRWDLSKAFSSNLWAVSEISA